MNINGYEIKPFINLQGANLVGADDFNEIADELEAL